MKMNLTGIKMKRIFHKVYSKEIDIEGDKINLQLKSIIKFEDDEWYLRYVSKKRDSKINHILNHLLDLCYAIHGPFHNHKRVQHNQN